MFKLINGDSLIELDKLEDNSIDAIITDPPYELGFMNKDWDSTGIAYSVDFWKKCLRVLKPGGHLVSFSSSKTFYRMICAIEDAGFEIRDNLFWFYGCLSNDTEILTSNGWRNSETIQKDDYIYSLDLDKNKLVKNKCLNVFKYDYDGEMVHLKNHNTDQLLTPNHHCIVKDKIRTRIKGQTTYTNHDYWCYKDAWQLRSNTFDLPLASEYDGEIKLGKLKSELLGLILSDGSYHKQCSGMFIYQTEANPKILTRIRYILGKLHLKYNEIVEERSYDKQLEEGVIKLVEDKRGKTYKNYTFYINACDLTQKFRELCPNKKLNWDLLELSLEDKESLIKGLCEGDGSKSYTNSFGYGAFHQNDVEQLEVFQSLLHMTNRQGWIGPNKRECGINLKPTTQLQGKHNKERFVKYDGKFVWCIETEVGNFVARRNGKVFITGNSGMPKGQNIGKMLDAKIKYGKSNSVSLRELELSEGVGSYNKVAPNNGMMGEKKVFERKYYQSENIWSGWNTQLKPAYEPITLARKPLDGTVSENVFRWRVGGLNVDECKVGDEIISTHKAPKGTFAGGELGRGSTREENGSIDYDEHLGRYPSNIISDGCLGDITRFYYCAKASSKDREEGLEHFTKKQMYEGDHKFGYGNTEDDNFGDRIANVTRANTHVAVKPTDLMQYLVRLISPKGATILDPFMGSGSTGKAIAFENRERDAKYSFIGIELDEEYCKIAHARIDWANKYEEDIESEVSVDRPKDLIKTNSLW